MDSERQEILLRGTRLGLKYCLKYDLSNTEAVSMGIGFVVTVLTAMKKYEGMTEKEFSVYQSALASILKDI